MPRQLRRRHARIVREPAELAATIDDGPKQATLPLNDPDAVRRRVATFFERVSTGRPIPGEMVAPGEIAERLPELAAELAETGQAGALDEAVDLLRQAVAATPRGDFDRVRYLFALDNALERRFELTGALADIDEAVDVADGRCGHHAGAWTMLPLWPISAMPWPSGRTTQASGDLDEAIQVGKKAKARSSADHPARAQILNNLGGASSPIQARRPDRRT